MTYQQGYYLTAISDDPTKPGAIRLLVGPFDTLDKAAAYRTAAVNHVAKHWGNTPAHTIAPIGVYMSSLPPGLLNGDLWATGMIE